jgi:ADP-ribose pyrophosphatase
MALPKKVGAAEIVWAAPDPRAKGKMVREQKYEFPDGRIVPFWLFGGQSWPVVVLPFTAAGEVILAHQWRPGAGREVYEAPGGHLEPGQSVEDALACELRQETGYVPERVIKLPEFWIDAVAYESIVRPYLALGCRKVTEQALEENELIRTVVLPLEEWLELCHGEENTRDGKTLAILALAMRYLPPCR